MLKNIAINEPEGTSNDHGINHLEWWVESDLGEVTLCCRRKGSDDNSCNSDPMVLSITTEGKLYLFSAPDDLGLILDNAGWITLANL